MIDEPECSECWWLSQVRWIETSPGEDVSFFSVAQDGRLTQWHLRDSCRLTHADVFEPHLPRTLGFEGNSNMINILHIVTYIGNIKYFQIAYFFRHCSPPFVCKSQVHCVYLLSVCTLCKMLIKCF